MTVVQPDFIVGENVALGPLRADLAAAYARWINQLEVRRGLDHMGMSGWAGSHATQALSQTGSPAIKGGRTSETA